MSVHVSSAIWKNSKHKGSNLLVLLSLADYANDEGICWPSIKSLCDRSRLNRRSVQLILRSLEESNELTRIGKTSKGVYKYAILVGGENFTPLDLGGEAGFAPGARLDSPGGEAGFAPGARLDSPDPLINNHINHQEEPSDSSSQKIDDRNHRPPIQKYREMHKRICIHFQEISGHEIPDPETAKEKSRAATVWWNPIDQIIKKVEYREDDAMALIQEAHKRLSKNGMTIKGPISILGTCDAIIAEVKSGRFKKTTDFRELLQEFMMEESNG